MIRSDFQDIFESYLKGELPTKEEIIELLKIDLDSPEFYALCYTANKLTREQFDNKADVCAQIGLDFAVCQYNCGFCSFTAQANKEIEKEIFWEAEDVIPVVKEIIEAGANAVYLMTTGRYSFDRFIEVGKKVREVLPDRVPLVANTSDFSLELAQKLKKIGFTAVCHSLRLREGIDTGITKETRLQTIENAQEAGLGVQVGLEPIGPEHEPEEMADQMIWAREIGTAFNGAMRRTAVSGTPLAAYGEISIRELVRAVAVTRLAMGDKALSHVAHEPNIPSFFAGANLSWAEAGPNPRDIKADTSQGRGKNVEYCRNLFLEAGFEVREGGSPACFGPSV